MKPSFALIGPGRVGCAVSKKLFNAGYPLTAVIGTNLDSAASACAFIGCDHSLAATENSPASGAQLILIAVPDDAIKTVALRLQEDCPLPSHSILLHFSGVHPAGIMRHPDSAVKRYSLHPLLPFADRQQAFDRLPDAAYAAEGDPEADQQMAEVAAVLGGTLWHVATEHKPLYHAAACISSNYLVTLLAEASGLLNICGLNSEQGLQILTPLLTATLENIKDKGVEQGLTGPIVRGDTGTVALHLKILEQTPGSPMRLYCALGLSTIRLAQGAGRLDDKQASAMTTLFNNHLASL